MRGRVLALVFVAIMMLSVGKIPDIVLASLPTVEYVQAQERVLEQELSCIGVVYAERESELYLDSPVIASQVLVSVGDRVDQAALLARVDTEQTRRILEESTALDFSSVAGLEEYENLARTITSGLVSGVDYGDLFKQYQSTFGAIQQKEQIYLQPEIKAPIAGVVTRVNLKPNSLTQLSEPAFVISDLTSCKVLATLSQSEMDKVHLGDSATISGSGMEGKSFAGVVTKIYPTAKRVYSGTVQEAMVEVEITLTDTSELLRPGYSVTVKIHDKETTPAVTLPYEAVEQDENNVEYVYLLTNDSEIRRQNITTGKEILGSIEIKEGVSVNDIVVFDPEKVKEGTTSVYVKGEAAVD